MSNASSKAVHKHADNPAGSPTATQHPLRNFELMERYRALRAADMAEFTKMTQQPGALLTRPCPACGADAAKPMFTKETFDFVECSDCACVYLMPVPTPALLDWYYDKSSAMAYFYEHLLKPSIPQRRAIFADRVAKLKPYLTKNASLLEVGASVGMFVEAAKNAGYKISGVEPNSELAATTSATYGVPIANCFIEDYTPTAPVDGVAIWEVIEHITHPADVLKKVHQLLTPGGILAMTLPNLDGIEFGICGPDHEMIEAPSHINYYTPKTLELLLERCGFEIQELTTPGILDFANILNHLRRQTVGNAAATTLWPEASEPPSDMGGAFLTWLHATMNDAEREQLEKIATDAIQRNRMSGNMFVVAKKI